MTKDRVTGHEGKIDHFQNNNTLYTRLEAIASTFRETQLEAVLVGQGYSLKLARQVAEARVSDIRYVEEKGDRKTQRRKPKA